MARSKPRSRVAKLFRMISRIALVASLVSMWRKRQMNRNDTPS